MMKAIKVLGTGCANCRATVARIEAVAGELGVLIAIEKVEQIQDIIAYGILATPGVVVDGTVVHSGGIPSREKIAAWLGQGGNAPTAPDPVTLGCGCAERQ
jgi:small redox-active disulfide protein 2